MKSTEKKLNALIDTNVILDCIEERKEFLEHSEKIMCMCESKEINGFLPSTSFTDLYYLAKKHLGHKKAVIYIKKILKIIDILCTGKRDILTALSMEWNDVEDSIISAIAEREKCDYIITRNVKDFENSKIKAIEPKEFWKIIKTN